MSDLLVSIIRTIVPAVVGLVLSAAVKAGIEVEAQVVTQLIDTLFIGGYYSLSRYLEQRYAWARWLLGLPVQPSYRERPLNDPS